MNQADPTAATPYIVSPLLRKKLQQCYEHGTRLMQQEKYDFDYAHSILLECAVNDPGNLVYIEAFLQNLQRKYNNNKRGSLLAFGGKGSFKKAVAKKDWAEVLRLGPEALKTNPWDVTVLRGMAQACAAFGYADVELRYLRNALDANPRDAAVNRHCAQSLARIGQFDQAIACWARVDEIRRGDVEAQQMISELQIAKTKAVQGGALPDPKRRGAAVPRPARTESASSGEESPEPSPRRELQLTPRQRLEQDIANNPADVDSYLELARLHIREERLGEAAHVLGRALAASGNQVRVQEMIEDVEILRKKHQLAVAERRAESDASEANRNLAQQLRDDLNRMELEVFDRRAQRYPGDLELKFQLGLRLKRAGNVREAIACFEKARGLPARSAVGALEIGECLQRQKQYDKALKQYWLAAETAAADTGSEGADQRHEVRKLALYRIGVLAEGLRNYVDAERSLSMLVQLDATFKDAATRLDKIQVMRHKQT